MKRILVYLLFIIIPTACTNLDLHTTETAISEISEPNATAVWLDDHPTVPPRWLSAFPTSNSCEGCGIFPRAECIQISNAQFATLMPEELPYFFLDGMTIEIDGETVPESNMYTLVDQSGAYYSPGNICFNTSDLDAGLHYATINIQIENLLDETYSWAFEVSD